MGCRIGRGRGLSDCFGRIAFGPPLPDTQNSASRKGANYAERTLFSLPIPDVNATMPPEVRATAKITEVIYSIRYYSHTFLKQK